MRSHLSVSGNVNSQNNLYGTAENPGLNHEVPLQEEKTGFGDECYCSFFNAVLPAKQEVVHKV